MLHIHPQKTPGRSVDLKTEDPHTVAGLLKQLLRELRVSAIPADFKTLFCRAAGNQPSDATKLLDIEQDDPLVVQFLKGLIHSLPRRNYQLLRKLFSLLEEITKHSDKNLMTASNLATIIGPTLTPSQGISLGYRVDQLGVEMMTQASAVNSVTYLMIENNYQIFGDEQVFI